MGARHCPELLFRVPGVSFRRTDLRPEENGGGRPEEVLGPRTPRRGGRGGCQARRVGAAGRLGPRAAQRLRRSLPGRGGGGAGAARASGGVGGAAGRRGGLLRTGAQRGGLRGGAARRVGDPAAAGAGHAQPPCRGLRAAAAVASGPRAPAPREPGALLAGVRGALRPPGQPLPGSLPLPAAPLGRLPGPGPGRGFRGPLVGAGRSDARLRRQRRGVRAPARAPARGRAAAAALRGQRAAVRREVPARGADRGAGGPGAVGGADVAAGEERPARRERGGGRAVKPPRHRARERAALLPRVPPWPPDPRAEDVGLVSCVDLASCLHDGRSRLCLVFTLQ